MSKGDPNVRGYKTLQGFVSELRRFVGNQLSATYGEGWMKRGVPPPIREEWMERQRRCQESRWVQVQADSPLDFSYENELKDVILRGDNWRHIFREFFGPDRKAIDVRLTEVGEIRNHIAHFRPITGELLKRLTSFTHDIRKSIALAGAVAAGNPTARLVSPDRLLSGEREPAALVALTGRPLATAGPAEPAPVDPKLFARVKELLMQLNFESGALPDESDVEPTGVHQFFDEWIAAREDEVLMWQGYAPREPVSKGSRVHLAIRYNPVAVKVPAVKEKQGVAWWRRRTKCAVRDPVEDRWTIIAEVQVEPENWTSLEYVPRNKGRHDVTWGARPSSRAWLRDEFDVR